jgi:hypothetical protein
MKTISLTKGRIVLFKKRIERICCTSGSLWVHWWRGEDVRLQGGESLECGRFSLVQIHALKDSTVEIEPAAFRLARALARLPGVRMRFGSRNTIGNSARSARVRYDESF